MLNNMDTEENFINENEVEETTETEETESNEEVEETTPEDTEDEAKKRAQSQIDRLKRERDEAKAELAKYKSSNKEESTISTEDAVLARLENRGVMHPEDQAYVLKFAKTEGISPVDALQDEIVKDKLAYFNKQRETRNSTISAPNRTGVKVDEVDKWVAKYKKDGSLPDNNPALVSKILDRLK